MELLSRPTVSTSRDTSRPSPFHVFGILPTVDFYFRVWYLSPSCQGPCCLCCMFSLLGPLPSFLAHESKWNYSLAQQYRRMKTLQDNRHSEFSVYRVLSPSVSESAATSRPLRSPMLSVLHVFLSRPLLLARPTLSMSTPQDYRSTFSVYHCRRRLFWGQPSALIVFFPSPPRRVTVCALALLVGPSLTVLLE